MGSACTAGVPGRDHVVRQRYLYSACCVVCPAYRCAQQHTALLPPALHHALLARQAGAKQGHMFCWSTSAHWWDSLCSVSRH